MNYRLAILGDICPDWGYPELFCTNDPKRVFHDLMPLLNEADYVVGNLECPLTDHNRKLEKNSINLKARPSDAKILSEAGICAVSLANNHILDYGVEGLENTIDNLEKNGINSYGVGNKDNASSPFFVKSLGITIGFISFAEREFNSAADYQKGASLWDDIGGIKEIHNAKKKCDYLIVQYHGGIENYKYPSPLLQKKCRAMAEAGADFITCQHSHVIGTRERWGNSEILYGQGNSIFGYSKEGGDDWNRGLICIIDFTIAEESISNNISYIPIVATVNGEYLARNDLKERVLQTFKENSCKLEQLGFVEKQWRDYCKEQQTTYLPMCFGWNVNLIRLNKLLNGLLVELLVRRKQKRNVMNLIRCDAHKEVVETILEISFYNDLNP